MTHAELIENLQKDFVANKNAMIIPDWQATASQNHIYDRETYVFCEIITAIRNKRNIIRISSSSIKSDKIPSFVKIDVLNVRFKNPDYPNMNEQRTEYKTIFKGNLSDENNDFSYPLLLSMLNSVEGFFNHIY
jgi:hypothetical protein